MLPFGKRIRIWRSLRGLSQTELSQIAWPKLDQAVIARHESTEGTVPRTKTIDIYASALLISRIAINGEERSDWALQDIFRPQSPWKSWPAEVYNRILADLKNLLPPLLADLGLDKAHLFHCELGTVATLTGLKHKLILVLPPSLTLMSEVISAVLSATFKENITDSKISELLYISFMLDPVGSLRLPDLPEGLQLHPKPDLGDLYRPPRPITTVFIELSGSRENLRERIESCFSEDEILQLEVHRPKDFKSHLPDEIQAYLTENGLDVDDGGRLISNQK
jgi:hypothetical protein